MLRLVPDWETKPDWLIHQDVADVAIDAVDRVYLLTRRSAQVVVYEKDGSFVTTWGHGHFSDSPHGITIDRLNRVFVVDELRNSVEIFTTDGMLLRAIGPTQIASSTGAEPSIPSIYDRIGSIKRSAGPYNRPTKVAVSASGKIFVSDGYGNARVHRFDDQGNYEMSFGTPGVGPGQFHCPHNVAVGPDGLIYVCDRENDRVQLFDFDGKFVGEWTDVQRPAAIAFRGDLVFVAEMAVREGRRSFRTGIARQSVPARLSVRDSEGAVLDNWQHSDPCSPYGLTAPHGLAIDSVGDVYIAEVTWTSGGRGNMFPADCHTLRKLSPSAMPSKADH